jgi:hypothetical protein
MTETTLEYAFGGVLLAFLLSLVALRRARSRGPLLLAAATPLAAWVGYEALVARVMPTADIRVDWLLLLPIALAHGVHALARWRRLGAGRLD